MHTHTYTHILTHILKHTHTYTHSSTHTHIHTYIHTYTHTYTYTPAPSIAALSFGAAICAAMGLIKDKSGTWMTTLTRLLVGLFCARRPTLIGLFCKTNPVPG